jgi:hypothetical protein
MPSIVTLMAASSRVVVLYEHGHDPSRNVVEVYDDPPPATWVEQVLPVEALAAGARVVLAMVGERHGREDQVDVLEQPTAAALKEVQPRARVEDNLPAIGICRPRSLLVLWFAHRARRALTRPAGRPAACVFQPMHE